jgi:hypothetical protein
MEAPLPAMLKSTERTSRIAHPQKAYSDRADACLAISGARELYCGQSVGEPVIESTSIASLLRRRPRSTRIRGSARKPKKDILLTLQENARKAGKSLLAANVPLN